MDKFDDLWPQSLLEHVVKAPSQYDAACRAMAGEILRLREALTRVRSMAYWQVGEGVQELRTRLACIGMGSVDAGAGRFIVVDPGNHHNPFACAYCNPDGRLKPAPLTEGE